ncbi:MAG: DNA-binding transcriptional regulator [Tepidisphaeraceae bacterium]
MKASRPKKSAKPASRSVAKEPVVEAKPVILAETDGIGTDGFRSSLEDKTRWSTPPSRSAAMKHVALLIETTGSYGRGLLTGIARYNRQHGRWSTYVRPHALTDPPPKWLSTWKGDGLLVRVDTKEMADLVKKTGAAIVNLRGVNPQLTLPLVSIDHVDVGRIAGEHLKNKGLKRFAFCGRPPGANPGFDKRCDGFRAAVEKEGGEKIHVFPAKHPSERGGWEEEHNLIAEWIKQLPKPVGILACNDERGLQVLDACRRAGVTVPDEVAVIGVDNDEPLCDLSIPPMTSVDVNSENIGFEAAALLDRMMSGQKAPSAPILLAPRGVVTRRSTDIVATEDDDVARALRYIRENACRGLQVVDVLAYLGMSRASLQQRMKQVMDRTIHQEIQRVRMDRAKELLVMSDMTIKQIARESGFASVQYMTRAFRSLTGETPAKYRNLRSK